MEAQFHNFTEGAIAFVSSTLKFSTYKNFLKYIHKGYSLAKIRIFFFFFIISSPDNGITFIRKILACISLWSINCRSEKRIRSDHARMVFPAMPMARISFDTLTLMWIRFVYSPTSVTIEFLISHSTRPKLREIRGLPEFWNPYLFQYIQSTKLLVLDKYLIPNRLAKYLKFQE